MQSVPSQHLLRRALRTTRLTTILLGAVVVAAGVAASAGPGAATGVGVSTAADDPTPCAIPADHADSRDASPAYPFRAWEGNNPFHQPSATTDYHGSGDADGNGSLTAADADVAQRMATGQLTPLTRADADGDGDVDGTDVALIQAALGGATLPAWWNELTSRAERDSWVTTFLARDLTDQHPYTSWFKCLSFSTQLHIHASMHRNDLFFTPYDGGQSFFNLPLYTASVAASSYGHDLGAILVGDDPLAFEDWRFIEGQTDMDAAPGDWNMPYGTEVRILMPYRIFWGGRTSSSPKVVFRVDESGVTLASYAPELILVRPSPPSQTPDNRIDLWNPRLLPIGEGKVLFDQMRTDMSRMTDIHLADLPLADPPAAQPLTQSSQYSRLLDVCRAPDGTVHFLWTGGADYEPGVFHAVLDPQQAELSGITRVSAGPRYVRMGRVLVLDDGTIHVFWLEAKINTQHPYDSGIYWSAWTGSGWSTAENLAPEIGSTHYYPGWEERDFMRYRCDAVIDAGGTVHLAWVAGTQNGPIHYRRFDGTWSDDEIVDADLDNRGLDLEADPSAGVHMAFWTIPAPGWSDHGTLLYRFHDGLAWSPPDTLDDGATAGYPQMAAAPTGWVYLVWETRNGSRVVPAWRVLWGGGWSPTQWLAVEPETDAWYPTVAALSPGRAVIAWSGRSPERVTVAYEYIGDESGIADQDGRARHSDRVARGASGPITLIVPNPYQPDAAIVCEFDRLGCEAQVAIYDLLGRQVRSLTRADNISRESPLRWDGMTDRGARVPAGVYWMRAWSGPASASRRILLVR